MNNFDKNLDLAKPVEQALARAVSGQVIDGQFKDYDIYCPRLSNVEVKFDSLSNTTGNWALEIYTIRNNPNGIFLSKAGTYAFVDDNYQAFLYSRNNLLFYLFFNDAYLQKTMNPEKTVYLKLLPVKRLERYCFQTIDLSGYFQISAGN